MSSTISPDESQHDLELAELFPGGDDFAAAGTARLLTDPDEAIGRFGTPSETGEPCCPKCGVAGQDTLRSWCRRCGYYGKLDTYIDLDPDEREYTPSELAALANEPARPLWRQIPGWGWQLAALVLAVLAAGVAARLLTPPDGTARMLLAVAGLVVGLLAFVAAHFAAYMVAAMDDSHLTLVDMVLRPTAVWGPSVRMLPEGRWRIFTAAGGLAAVFSALAVVDGIPFERMWGEPQKQPRLNVVKEITGMAQGAEGTGESDLGESIKDFADGGAGPGGGGGDGGEAEGVFEEELAGGEQADGGEDPGPEMLENPFVKDPPIRRPLEVQCLIAGYVPQADNPAGFQSLVLVANIRGQLQYVGDVSEGIHEQVRRELNRELPALVVAAPLLPSARRDVRWLQPNLTCQVKFAEWTSDDQLAQPLFEQLIDPATQPTQPPSTAAETPSPAAPPAPSPASSPAAN